MRESLDSESAEEINSKTEALTAAFQKVSEQIYAAAQEEQAAASARRRVRRRRSSADEEEVVDAEVVDEGDDK